LRRVRRLLRQLVKCLPPVSGPWEISQPDVNDLPGFRDCNDDEINLLRQDAIPIPIAPQMIFDFRIVCFIVFDVFFASSASDAACCSTVGM
jgi:hypothetical protein